MVTINGIIEIDLHGRNQYQAKVMINAKLARADGAYRIRIIHGFNSGNTLKNMIFAEYSLHPKVLRLVSINTGVTDLVLKEL